MKIEIGESFTLIQGGAESPEDLEVNAECLLQVAEGVRASAPKAFNRGNRATTLKFQITRTYASAGAAEQALFEHPGEIPTEGDITITCEPGGESATVITLSDATVHAFAARQIGLSIQWRYTITAGAVSIEEPE